MESCTMMKSRQTEPRPLQHEMPTSERCTPPAKRCDNEAKRKYNPPSRDRHDDSQDGGRPQAIDYFRCRPMVTGRYEPEWYKGYGIKCDQLLYSTTNGQYGSMTPAFHTISSTFYDRHNKFTNHLGVCGMYRNRSLNCNVDTCEETKD